MVQALRWGFVQVKRNDGAPGIDGVTTPTERVKFLGMTMVEGTLAISRKAMNAAMAKVKTLTPRGSHQKLKETVEGLNRRYEGWSAYCAQTQYPSQLKRIEAQIASIAFAVD